MAAFAPEVLALLSSPRAGVGGGMAHGAFGGPIGNVFYVNGGADALTTGIDAVNRGTKDLPFLTIAYALTQCVTDNDDYIICWNTYNQDTFPIVISLDSVHIIGVASPNGGWPALDATVGNTAVFTLATGIENVEIAGWNLAGGAAHAAIEFVSGNNMTWIHHCTFGHYWFGPSQDGIGGAGGGGNHFSVIIEDCWFYGSGGPNGNLTRCGIISGTGASWGEWTIRNNFFVALPTRAIDLGITIEATVINELIIEHNIIGCVSDTDNIAIALSTKCHDCVISDNKAQYGKVTMTNNPFGDAASDNHWMCNQVGSVMKFPDEAM